MTDANRPSAGASLAVDSGLPHLPPPGVEGLEQVDIKRVSLAQLARALAPDRVEQLRLAAERARRLLAGRIVWNVNSTAHGRRRGRDAADAARPTAAAPGSTPAGW